MKKVLFIEDDQLLSRMYVMKFSEQGFETATAEDGLEGMKQVISFKPDLLVLDLMLPKMNGVDVLKFVRSSSNFKNLPVIVLSNAYMNDLVREAAAAGPSLALNKSNCTPKQLVEIVGDLLEGRPVRVNPEALLLSTRQSSLAQSAPQSPLAPAAGPTSAPAATAPALPPSKPKVQIKPPASTPDHQSAQIQKKLVENFAKESLRTACGLSDACDLLVERFGSPLQPGNLLELEKRMRAFSNQAGMIGLGDMADFTSGIDALLVHLLAHYDDLTPSVLLTLSQAVNLLTPMLENCSHLPRIDTTDFKILAVDDDQVCLKAIQLALRKARLLAFTTDNPGTAWKMITETRYDLLLLDVVMPGTSGFDLCARVRSLPDYQQTPVIFVTSQSDYQSLARSRLSGGTDLIAKPFVTMELAVKALTRLHQQHLASVRRLD